MKFLKGNPDFLIIGGGIFGCAIAWNLSRRSSGSVLLLERQGLASATTPRAAGLIRNLNLKQGQTALKSYTIEAIGLLSEELEESLHWHQVGGLLVAESEANIKHLENLERHASQGPLNAKYWFLTLQPEVHRLDANEGILLVPHPVTQ